MATEAEVRERSWKEVRASSSVLLLIADGRKDADEDQDGEEKVTKPKVKFNSRVAICSAGAGVLSQARQWQGGQQVLRPTCARAYLCVRKYSKGDLWIISSSPNFDVGLGQHFLFFVQACHLSAALM